MAGEKQLQTLSNRERESGVTEQKTEFFTTGQVAELFGVHPRTVIDWAKESKIPHIRTLGGNHRYPKIEILAMLEAAKVKVQEQ